MWILPLVGWIGSAVGFGFLTLALASGLYYLSELVEEHTVLAKRILTRLIYCIIALQLLLCVVDRFPFWLSMFGIVSHVIYLGNMRRFPYVKLADPLFLTSCLLVLLNHWFWFKHFSRNQARAYQNMSSYYDTSDVPTFTEIASYFGLCVWLVPFSLFVSLSASDNILPTMGHEDPTMSTSAGGGGRTSRKGQGMAKALVDGIRSAITEVGVMAGYKRPENRF